MPERHCPQINILGSYNSAMMNRSDFKCRISAPSQKTPGIVANTGTGSASNRKAIAAGAGQQDCGNSKLA